MPDIAALQAWLEAAWAAGYDAAGAEQLGNAVQGTHKWVGTTEAATLLRLFGVRAFVVDFRGASMAVYLEGLGPLRDEVVDPNPEMITPTMLVGGHHRGRRAAAPVRRARVRRRLPRCVFSGLWGGLGGSRAAPQACCAPQMGTFLLVSGGVDLNPENQHSQQQGTTKKGHAAAPVWHAHVCRDIRSEPQ